MRGDELHVDEPATGRREPRVEVDERGLGRVGAHVEHGLGHEGGADEHAEHPADELVVLPHLDAVRPAEPVQLLVGAGELGGDPGTPGALAAVVHDVDERVVEGGRPVARAHPLEQRVGHAHPADGQYTARIRAPPGEIGPSPGIPRQFLDVGGQFLGVAGQDGRPAAGRRRVTGPQGIRHRDRTAGRLVGRLVGRPGKDAPSVGPDQGRRGEITTEGERSVTGIGRTDLRHGVPHRPARMPGRAGQVRAAPARVHAARVHTARVHAA